jgi:uncharacterized protein YerC
LTGKLGLLYLTPSMRTSGFKLNPSFKNQIEVTFCQLISDIKTPKEAEIFFKDFLNETEYETFVKRLAIAYWLKKKRSYANIKQNLKVSSATIAVIQTLMQKPGFKMALKKIEADEWANVWAEKIKKITRHK